MKTKYVIPKEAIEDFKKSLERTIKVYEMIVNDLKLGDYINKDLKEEKDPDDTQLKNMAIVVFNGFIRDLKDLKNKVSHINTKKVENINLSYFLGFLELTNPLSNAIVIKIMKDTENNEDFNKMKNVVNIEGLDNSYEFQKLFCGLLDGYYLPKDNLNIVNSTYLQIITNSGYLSKFMVEGLITSPTIREGLVLLANRIAFKNMDSWQEFFNNYETKYRDELTKLLKHEKEYKKGTTLMYTETKELEYYIKGGVVKHLCAPRTFDELLKRNNYGLNARVSLEKQMKNTIMMASLKETNDLIGAYLGSIDIRYQEMWAYLVENVDNLKQVYLEDIRKNFYLVPEIGEGYGYTKEDFDYFMIDSLVSNYHLAKNHNKALRLIRNGKINVNFEKSGKKFKKIA